MAGQSKLGLILGWTVSIISIGLFAWIPIGLTIEHFQHKKLREDGCAVTTPHEHAIVDYMRRVRKEKGYVPQSFTIYRPFWRNEIAALRADSAISRLDDTADDAKDAFEESHDTARLYAAQDNLRAARRAEHRRKLAEPHDTTRAGLVINHEYLHMSDAGEPIRKTITLWVFNRGGWVAPMP